MRTTTLLLTLLLGVAGAAAAQMGPAPGYDDAVSYGADYAATLAENATADPAGYAANKTTADNLTAEVAHTAYIACWAADDAGVPDATGVCSNYYTPPGTADALNEDEENGTAESLEAGAHNLTGDLNGTLNETLDALNDTLADPTSAPHQIERIVDAVADFLNGTLAFVVGVVEDLTGGLVGGLVGLGEGVGIGASAAGDGLVDLGGLLGKGGLAVGDGIGAGAAASWDGAGSLTSGVADGVSTAGGAVADGFSAAGRGIADGVSSAADAVGDAVSSAVSSVTDTVRGWFGGDEDRNATGPARDLTDDATDDLDADGLLEPVRDLVNQ